MKYYLLILIALLSTSTSFAASLCGESFTVNSYANEKRGEVVLYRTVSLTQSGNLGLLNCIVSTEFIKRAYNIPPKATVGIVTSDYRYLLLAQWNLPENIFMVIQIEIPQGSDKGMGSFFTYPNPTERIREAILNERFPVIEDTTLKNPRYNKHLVSATINSVKTLLGE